jgi:plasmid maintenance system antidote protein VapI
VWTNLQKKYDLTKAAQSEKKDEYETIKEKMKSLVLA